MLKYKAKMRQYIYNDKKVYKVPKEENKEHNNLKAN